MTVHQCPKCELRFDYKTELDDHCWHDHPQFRHDYPAQGSAVADIVPPRPARPTAPREPRHLHARDLVAWLEPEHHIGE